MRLVVPALAALVSLAPIHASAERLIAKRFVPERHAENTCTDTPLSITFNQAPVLGTTGTIRVYSSDDTLVDSIDLADPSSAKRPIGGASASGQPYLFNYHPVIITGNTAGIYLHHALDYEKSYYVLIDTGVFIAADGSVFRGILRKNRWRFMTKESAPPDGASRLVVDARGHGDFCTVQGAIDFVPTNNTSRVVIQVHRGTYREIVYVNSRKPFITPRHAPEEMANEPCTVRTARSAD